MIKTSSIFLAKSVVILVLSLAVHSCIPTNFEKETQTKINQDSIKRLDSILESINQYSIKIKDKYARHFLDTTFNDIKVSLQQYSDAFYVDVNYAALPTNTDTLAKNYYFAVISLKNLNSKKLNKFKSMLRYYNYCDDNEYLKYNAVDFVAPIVHSNKHSEYSWPMWHLQTDNQSETELVVNFKLYTIDSTTYKKTNNLHASQAKYNKPIWNFNKRIKLKNYTYYIKEFSIDSVTLLDKAYDFGLFAKPDLYFNLFTPNNSLTSTTDEQYTDDVAEINSMYLFLTEPKGPIILKFYDEDVLYHDFLGGLRFNYNQADSNYAFKFDSINDNTDIRKLSFSLKNIKEKE